MSTAAHGQFIIGNYRVGQTIGEGTFGKVRLGTHLPTQMKVAVKTLQKQKIVEQADIERVTRQICILKILRHPNIVQLYEIIETKTDIHLIMEYAPGGQLFDYIVRKKRLEEQQAVSFMQQILSGVQYIHKIGIVHRDLKPQNLLFDENRRIKIVDFGLSNQYKPGQKLKTACGSPCYAAPQMIAGKRYQCLNIDIWSCGIILYAMLCGYLPFQDPNTNKLYKKIMMGQYQQPKILTNQSKQMLKNILNTNPETRFKVNNIKQSKWFNLTHKKYQAKGIIVGNDTVPIDQSVINTMKKMGVTAELSQIKNYICNNRHNHITAFYYLLKKKAQKNPSVLLPQKQQKRSNSPLIYKPEHKKDYFIPTKRPSTTTNNTKDTKVNDSINASKIVSSLVQANKNKLINNLNKQKKKDNFQKVQEFKLFPKTHKNNSQIQQKSSVVTPINLHSSTGSHNKTHSLTARSDAQDKKHSFVSGISADQQSLFRPSFRPQSAISTPTPQKLQEEPSTPAENTLSESNTQRKQRQISELSNPQKQQQMQIKNKRRQELSDQLKQISLKIDKQILELRKHNNMTSSMMSEKRRQSFGSSLTNKFKAPEQHSTEHSNTNPNTNPNPNPNTNPNTNNTNTNTTNINTSKGHNVSIHTQNKSTYQQQRIESQPDNKLHMLKQSVTKFPKMHFGPFNTQCLLMQAPRTILQKISQRLDTLKLTYKEVDSFTIRLSNNQLVSVQSIHGIAGYHIVKFSTSNPINQCLIAHLSQG